MLTRATQVAAALRWRLAAAALSGALYRVSLPDFDQHYLGWVCLLPLLWAVDAPRLSWRAAAGVATVFGAVAHLGGHTWIADALPDNGPREVLGYVVHFLTGVFLFGAWGCTTQWLVQRRGAPWVWAAPTTFVLCEWLLGQPAWPALASSQYRQTVLIQTLELWGPLGVSFMMALTQTVLCRLLRRLLHREPAPAWRPSATAGLLVAGSLAFGAAALRDTHDSVAHALSQVHVGIVQIGLLTNGEQSSAEEWLRRYRQQSAEVSRQGAQLIIWPELALRDPDDAHGVRDALAGELGAALLFGGVRREREGASERRYNAAFLTDAAGHLLGAYDKVNPPAFVSSLPVGAGLAALGGKAASSARFAAGSEPGALLLDGVRYGLLVGHEEALPGFVRELMQRAPHVLVSLSRGPGPSEQRRARMRLGLATLRAIEQRRFLVRATESGISAVIDPAGRTVTEAPLFARANLVHTVAALERTTLYARLGDWPAYVALAALLAWSRLPRAALRWWRLARGSRTPARS